MITSAILAQIPQFSFEYNSLVLSILLSVSIQIGSVLFSDAVYYAVLQASSNSGSG